MRRLSRDSAPHLMNCAVNMARVSAQTAWARWMARWWGVELGNGCRFYGLPIFRRHPGAAIRVGAGCEFRSAKWANLVGVYRPCMLSAMTEHAVLEIGEGSGLSGTSIGCALSVAIGRRVMCGANVTITDTDWHPLGWRQRAEGKLGPIAPVTIGDDVWLGMNAMVLKGVSIGPRTVVGAGSIVTRSLPEGVIAAGQPAVAIRKLRPDEDAESVAALHAS